LFSLGAFLLLAVSLLGHFVLLTGDVGRASAVFAGGILLCFVWCLPALALVWYLDRREREAPWLLVAALLWGGVIATGSAGVLNSLLGLGLVFFLLSSGLIDPEGLRRLAPEESSDPGEVLAMIVVPVLVAPMVEESLKGLGVLLIMWLLRAEFDDLRDGIVYGALVGLGFSITEYGLYLARMSLMEGAPLTAFDLLVLRQPFFGVNNHLIWTALTGAGLGLARQTARTWVKFVAPIGFFGLAVGGHATQNSFGVLLIGGLSALFGQTPETAGTPPGILAAWAAAAIGNIVPQLLPLGLLGFLLVRGDRWEIAVIRQFLADEVGTGATTTVTPEEYLLVLADRPFHTRRLTRPYGRWDKAIVNAQNELAFRKWHLSRERPGHVADDPLVAAWREDVAALRSRSKR
jgi:RsiW-degrading membrane proteinase PrsW (M82 family)